jgi:PAS domain S-box-containing protein
MDLISRGENLQRIIVYIIFSTLIIFYIDIITPLGLTIWILYFIPLFMTLYIQWKYAPYAGAGVFILFIAISFFISPRDVSELFAIINRVFFSVMLMVTALLISYYKNSIEDLQKSEKMYRYLTEWSPDAILVQQEGKILYANPAGRRLFAASTNEELFGKDIVNLVIPDEHEIIHWRMDQAILGAKIQIQETNLVRFDGKNIVAEALLSEIIWDGKSAVQIILRQKRIA